MTAMQKPCTEVALVLQVILFSITTIIPQRPTHSFICFYCTWLQKQPFSTVLQGTVRFAANIDAVANDLHLLVVVPAYAPDSCAELVSRAFLFLFGIGLL